MYQIHSFQKKTTCVNHIKLNDPISKDHNGLIDTHQRQQTNDNNIPMVIYT